MTPEQKLDYWTSEQETAQRALEVAQEKLQLVQRVGQLSLFLSYRSSWKLHETE